MIGLGRIRCMDGRVDGRVETDCSVEDHRKETDLREYRGLSSGGLRMQAS